MAEHNHSKKNFYSSLSFLLLTILAFIILYTIIFFTLKTNLQKSYDSANSMIPMVKTGLSNPGEVTKYFDNYAWLGGIIFGVLALIISLILYGISALLKLTKHYFTTGTVLIITYCLLFIFAFILVFLEKAYVPWANGIIYFMGHPLLYSTILMILLSAGSIFLSRGKAK